LTKKKVYLTPAIVSQTKLMVTARQKTLYVARAMFFATERLLRLRLSGLFSIGFAHSGLARPFRNRASPISSWLF
jgi:hypothetical protein